MLQQMGVLQNLNNVPVDMTLSGLSALQNAQQMDQLSLANQQREFDFNTAKDPLALEAARLGNESTLARLPGMHAESSMATRKDGMEAIMHDQQIAELRRKYKDSEIKSYIQGLSQAGEVMRNAGEILFQSPLGGNLRAKQMLEQAGAGGLWSPEWDSMRPDQLAQKLHEIGKAFQENGSKYSQALDTTAMKADSAAAIAEGNRQAAADRQRERIAAQVEAQRLRIDAADKLAKWKQSIVGSKDPKNFEGLAVQYTVLAKAAADNPEEAQQYMQAAQAAYAQALALKTAATDAANAVKPNLPALGIQTNGVPPGPREPKPMDRRSQFEVIRD